MKASHNNPTAVAITLVLVLSTPLWTSNPRLIHTPPAPGPGKRLRLPVWDDQEAAAAQDQLWCLLWDDLIAYLKEKWHGESIIEELERLRVA